jgi:hypothetical protein
MPGSTLAELIQEASKVEQPSWNSPFTPALGGVDPLGLRQINFDLMDLVIPGLNNVVRYIRPFTVISWAWRRAAICAERAGKLKVTTEELQDFVDRIEVLYVWSQLLRDGAASLPGREFLGFLVKTNSYTFGGASWKAIRNARKYSTALSAPINYGPVVKSFGWIEQAKIKGAYKSTVMVSSALDAFDKALNPYLTHPAFSSLGTVSVSREEAECWGTAWDLTRPSVEECKAIAYSFGGDLAPKRRKDGSNLIHAAAAFLNGNCQVNKMRRIMCGESGGFLPPATLSDVAEHWNAVQARQLFRLSLEALLHWVILQLGNRAKTTSMLAAQFVIEAGDEVDTQSWLVDSFESGSSPVDRIDQLQKALEYDQIAVHLSLCIRAGLASSLSSVAKGVAEGRQERLPLERARREMTEFLQMAPVEFLEHVLGSWVFGQHVYWAVGRGLGDARSRGKTLLRLKVVPEENGWTLAPGAGASVRNPPRPTPDRLESALRLMIEAKML